FVVFVCIFFFFFQAEDGIRDFHVTGVQTCALPIYAVPRRSRRSSGACPAASRCAISTTWRSPLPYTRRSARASSRIERRTFSCRSEERRVGKECRSRSRPDR